MRCLHTVHSSSQRSFWMWRMRSMGCMVSTLTTHVSGIHWQQAECAHSPGDVVGFSAPPSTGQSAQRGASAAPPPVSSHAAHSQPSAASGSCATP